MTDLSKLSVDELLNELQRSALAGEWVVFGMAKSQLSTNASSRAARISELEQEALRESLAADMAVEVAEKERDEAYESCRLMEDRLNRLVDQSARVVVLENALWGTLDHLLTLAGSHVETDTVTAAVVKNARAALGVRAEEKGGAS